MYGQEISFCDPNGQRRFYIQMTMCAIIGINGKNMKIFILLKINKMQMICADKNMIYSSSSGGYFINIYGQRVYFQLTKQGGSYGVE